MEMKNLQRKVFKRGLLQEVNKKGFPSAYGSGLMKNKVSQGLAKIFTQPKTCGILGSKFRKAKIQKHTIWAY